MILTNITPFANDTYAFAALEKGLVETKLNYSIFYMDIEKINKMSISGQGDLNKISFSTLGRILDNYFLLPVGSCLGYHNGPKIIAREKFNLYELEHKKIGIPGTNTTAYLLLKILAPQAAEELIFPYHDLLGRVLDGSIDCALTIHETRFQLEDRGLFEIGDLFRLWTAKTDLPLPLGGIAARKKLGEEKLRQISRDLQKSLEIGNENKKMAIDFALEHSYDKDPRLVKKNVGLYINEETRSLSPVGIKSIQTLLDLGNQAGIFPIPAKDWLFE